MHLASIIWSIGGIKGLGVKDFLDELE